MRCAGFEPQYRCRVQHCDSTNATYFSQPSQLQLPSFYTNQTISLAHRCFVPSHRSLILNQCLLSFSAAFCNVISIT